MCCFAGHLERKRDIVRYRHMGKQRIGLEYGMDGAFFRRRADHILAVQ